MESDFRANGPRSLIAGEDNSVVDFPQMTTVPERVAHLEGKISILIWVLGGCAVLLLALFGYGLSQLSTQNARLAVLESIYPDQKLKQISENPSDPVNIEAASRVLNDAKQRNVRIDPSVLATAADRFMSASRTAPETWPVVQDFLNYRSFLNASAVGVPADLRPASPGYHFNLNTRPLPVTRPQGSSQLAYVILLSGQSPPNESARLEGLSTPNSVGTGVRLIVVDGSPYSALVLDNTWLKNVIVRNAVVAYDGGPMRLENTVFLNCTFMMARTPDSTTFGERFLAATSINMDVSSSAFLLPLIPSRQ
jgi:hypothetical protein